MATKNALLRELESLKTDIVGTKKKGAKKSNPRKPPKSTLYDESSTIKKLKIDKQVASLAFHGEEDAFHINLADVAVNKAAHDILAELGYEATDSDVATDEETDVDVPELEGRDTMSIEGMSRADFKDAMSATELERKEVSVTVDLSKQIPKSSVTMGEFSDKLSFKHMAPVVITETTLVLQKGFLDVPDDHVMFLEVNELSVSKSFEKPKITPLPENVGPVVGEVVDKNMPLPGPSVPYTREESTMLIWKQEYSTYPLTFLKAHRAAKLVDLNNKQFEKQVPRSSADYRMYMESISSDQSQDRHLSELLYIGLISHTSKTNITYNVIKRALKPVQEKVKAKVVNVPMVDTMQSECSMDTEKTECSTVNFTEEEEVFVTRSDMNTLESVVPEKIGQLAPNSTIHIYDTILQSICLFQPDEAGMIHGTRPNASGSKKDWIHTDLLAYCPTLLDLSICALLFRISSLSTPFAPLGLLRRTVV